MIIITFIIYEEIKLYRELLGVLAREPRIPRNPTGDQKHERGIQDLLYFARQDTNELGFSVFIYKSVRYAIKGTRVRTFFL